MKPLYIMSIRWLQKINGQYQFTNEDCYETYENSIEALDEAGLICKENPKTAFIKIETVWQ